MSRNKKSQTPRPTVGNWDLAVGIGDWGFRRRLSRRVRLIRHVEEERARSALLRQRALTLFGGLARLFAVLAADRERQGPQPCLRNLLAALETVAVRALVEPMQRR